MFVVFVVALSKIPIPHPTPAPPRGALCTPTTNSIAVTFDAGAHNSHTLYEVQVGLADHPTFVSKTADSPAATIDDLWPNTSYTFLFRKRESKLQSRPTNNRLCGAG